MTPLLFDGSLYDPLGFKAKKRSTPIFGSSTFRSGFIKALFQYSKRDPIYLIGESNVDRDDICEIVWDNIDRVKFISPCNIEQICDQENLIWMSAGSGIFELAWARHQILRAGVPIIGVTHALHGGFLFPWFSSAVMKVLYEHDALVCTSSAAKKATENMFTALPEELRPLPKIPFETPIIPGGIDTEWFSSISCSGARQRLGIASEDCVVLYFGRFSTSDKCDLAPVLLAFSRLSPHPPTKLLLVGDDTISDLTTSLRELAHDLCCSERVIIVPTPGADRTDFFEAADIFISPSDTVGETFGLTVVEAMASGLPVVVSDWSGYKDLVHHGITGFLIPSYMPAHGCPFDVFGPRGSFPNYQLLAFSTSIDVHQMTAFLSLLVNDRELRKRMGERARKQARARWDWRVVMGEYETLWTHLLEKNGRVISDVPIGDRFTYQNSLGHYPTQILDESHWIEWCDDWPKECTNLWSHFEGGGVFQQTTATAVYERLKDGATALKDLLDTISVSSEPADRIRASMHIARLLKYGAIQLK